MPREMYEDSRTGDWLKTVSELEIGLPSGMTAKQWLEEHGMTDTALYKRIMSGEAERLERRLWGRI